MNLMLRQATRKPAFTILMVLLLSLAMALSCIGYSALRGAKLQLAAISGGYTTIAMLKHIEIPTVSYEYEKFAAAGGNELWYKQMRSEPVAVDAPQLEMIDHRFFLTAHVPGSRALSSASIEPFEYNETFEHERYSLAVFALRCTELEDEWPDYDMLHYDAKFSVEEVISLIPAYDCFPEPDEVIMMTDLHNADGSIPFQEGHTYLFFGQYRDHPVIKGEGLPQRTEDYHGDGFTQLRGGGRLRYIWPFVQIKSNAVGFLPDGYEVRRIGSSLAEGTLGGKTYWYAVEGQLPWVAEYTGSPQAFLNSEEGKLWREDILNLCKLNYETATVVLTDRVTSIYPFNTGELALLSGRFFNQAEYQRGDAVCMVSAAYAEHNGYMLGDTIVLDYYDSGFSHYANGGSVTSLFAGGIHNQPYYAAHLATPEDAIGVKKEYTIIGIYTGPRFTFGAYNYNADTIFVPKASVPDAEKYEAFATPRMNTYILKNGTAEAFEAYMAEQGFADMYTYFDQDFSETEVALAALETNAMRLLLLGVGAYVLVGALFLFLNARRVKPVVRGARLLGRPCASIWNELFIVVLLQAGCATVLGIALAAVLYDSVTQNLLSGALALQPVALIAGAAVLFAALLAAGAVWAAFAVRRNLMKRK